ncbi:peptide chain release factor N(5)-glutamine methyltransferase [Zhongshania sp.]|uniref:peptide chain release factor N(5)-glutamine methyltransferase n=1 Tax=Zhongshania sp. TaxID=1971902 RepID=UPI003563293E
MSTLSIADALAYRGQLAALSDSAELDTALLLCYCLGKPRSYLYSWPERALTAEEQAQFQALFARRAAGEPIAHILGYRDFWSLSLAVSPASLIPRPDTECLVERALEIIRDQIRPQILDLGTGTGAIALALASERSDADVLGLDCVADAVALAKANSTALSLRNVRFQQSNWFAALDAKRYQLIVSNPPYIDADDPHLREGDVRFEPRSALVAADGGMADLKHIIQFAPEYLHADGVLLLEHGFQQASAVRQVFSERGFSGVETRCDYGGNERISWGVWRHE